MLPDPWWSPWRQTSDWKVIQGFSTEWKVGRGFPGLVVKSLPANAGDVRGAGSIPGLGRCPGEGHGNPLQYSCLENPMDRGVWWAIIHRVAELDVTEET